MKKRISLSIEKETADLIEWYCKKISKRNFSNQICYWAENAIAQEGLWEKFSKRDKENG